MANGIAIWSGKWKITNWKINGKDIWSKKEWIKLSEYSEQIKIIVYHVDAHKKERMRLAKIMKLWINWQQQQ